MQTPFSSSTVTVKLVHNDKIDKIDLSFDKTFDSLSAQSCVHYME